MSTSTNRRTFSLKSPAWTAIAFSVCNVTELSLKGSVPWRESLVACIEPSVFILMFGYIVREIVAPDDPDGL